MGSVIGDTGSEGTIMKNPRGSAFVVLAAGLALEIGCGSGPSVLAEQIEFPDGGLGAAMLTCCRNVMPPGNEREQCLFEGLRGDGYCGHVVRYDAGTTAEGGTDTQDATPKSPSDCESAGAVGNGSVPSNGQTCANGACACGSIGNRCSTGLDCCSGLTCGPDRTCVL
jgi:hypothetical protein